MNDCLVMEGLTTSAAETLLKSVASEVYSLAFEVTLIKEYMDKAKGKSRAHCLASAQLFDVQTVEFILILERLDTLRGPISLSLIKAGSEWTGPLPAAVEEAHRCLVTILCFGK